MFRSAGFGRKRMSIGVIDIGGVVAHSPLPHHRTCGSAYGRFSSVELEHVQQPRKTESIEVSNRECRLQGRAVGQAPGAMGTAGGLCREVMSDVPLALAEHTAPC